MVVVGKYKQSFNDLTGQNLPCTDIYQSDGLEAHVRKHHPSETDLLKYIPSILSSPDYIGHHPGEPDSVELVKILDVNAMVCVKLDTKAGYLYVASVFSINNSKLSRRISSGRLKKC